MAVWAMPLFALRLTLCVRESERERERERETFPAAVWGAYLGITRGMHCTDVAGLDKACSKHM